MRPQLAQGEDNSNRQCRGCHGRRVDRVDRGSEGGDLVEEGAGLIALKRDPEKIAQLACEDDHRDAGGKANGDGIRNELDVFAEPQIAGSNQHHPGHHRRQQETVDAVAIDRGSDQHDEGASRTADLGAAAAEEGDKKAADNGGIEAAIRRDARCDGDRHRQGQGNDCDSEAGDRVGAQAGAVISFSENAHDLRNKSIGHRLGLRPEEFRIRWIPGGACKTAIT